MTNLEKYLSLLDQGNYDALLLTSPISRKYCAEFNVDEGVAIVTRKGCRYYTDSRYIETAEKNLKGFDVRMVSKDNGYIKQLNEAIAELGVTTLGFEEDEKDTKAMNRLKIASEKAKIQLSIEKVAIIDIDEFYNDQLLHMELSRETFETICEDLFNKLIPPLDKVLDDAKVGISDIKEIVFVGGSTRIPKIKTMIQDYGCDIHINNTINPDETVAYGAAIQAAKLVKQETDILDDVILMDITPFSLGIETLNISEDEEIKKKR